MMVKEEEDFFSSGCAVFKFEKVDYLSQILPYLSQFT